MDWKLLNPEKIYRIKANLTTKKETNHKSLMHIDTNQEKIKTAVYYCNTNNGCTLFQNGKRIEMWKSQFLAQKYNQSPGTLLGLGPLAFKFVILQERALQPANGTFLGLCDATPAESASGMVLGHVATSE